MNHVAGALTRGRWRTLTLKIQNIMNTFPLKNKNYKGEICKFRPTASLPTFEWGKKIYALIDGKLRAVVPIATVACFQKDRQYEDYLGNGLFCKIAGEEGNKFLWDCLRFKFFETPDDYARHLSGVESKMVIRRVDIRDILSVDLGLEVGGDYGFCFPVKWSWDAYNLKPEKCGTTINALWMDEDGSHVELSMHSVSNLSSPVYDTPEECILANTAPVVDFDDPEPSKQGLMDESNGHESELVRRINDAWDKRRDDFRPILCALYDRDHDKIYSHSVKEIGELPDSRFHTLSEEWEKWAGPYLRVVASNNDLSTILYFLEFGNK